MAAGARQSPQRISGRGRKTAPGRLVLFLATNLVEDLAWKGEERRQTARFLDLGKLHLREVLDRL